MNHKLYKELRDAGFPQEGTKEAYCIKCKKLKTGDCFDKKHKTEFLKYPTLEELIDACDNKQFRLQRWNAGLTWLASVPHETIRMLIIGEDKDKKTAVAKLYIKLNG